MTLATKRYPPLTVSKKTLPAIFDNDSDNFKIKLWLILFIRLSPKLKVLSFFSARKPDASVTYH